MTKTFCTLSDFNFLPQGLALWKSLMKYDQDFYLEYLCCDNESYDYLMDHLDEYPNIMPISLNELMFEFPELTEAKLQDPSFEAKQVGQRTGKNPRDIQFFWCLSAFFTWYCLDQLSNKDVLYIDSDIYFFDNWKKVYDAIEDASVGLVDHRIPFVHNNGKYNVGIVYFKNDLQGNQAAWSWKTWLTGEDTTYQRDYGHCGDQKYLELFPKLFTNVVCLDDKGLLHQAPWNYPYTSKDEKIVYYHFSNFSPDYEENRYSAAPRHNILGLDGARKKWYDEYFESCKEMKRCLDQK